MENHLVPVDKKNIENIISHLKETGVFDEFRHECLVDVETKSSFQNMSNSVEEHTANFLEKEEWNPYLNKNDVRNKLRKDLDDSGILTEGAAPVVEEVIQSKIKTLFLPKIMQAVANLNKKQEKLSSETSCKSTTNANPAVYDPVADNLSSPPDTLLSYQMPVCKNLAKIGSEKVENEVSSSPEPKRRDSGRERKPNPKFASDEYCFSLWQTFITEQKLQSDSKKISSDDANKDMSGTSRKLRKNKKVYIG